MDAGIRIEAALDAALGRAGDGGPPGLTAAMRDAVFPGGARIRPRLCLAVAAACDEEDPAITDAAAAAIELLHCASLVHDDLPCFDNAEIRRGKPAVHRAFGEPLAVLAGDALIVLAFEVLAEGAGTPRRLIPLIRTIGRAVGAPNGIVAGQAWESETDVVLADYHRAKTGSLFAAATMAGAIAAGANGEAWWALGDLIGHAYQVADDLRDAVGDAAELGKPTGVDGPLSRPNAVLRFGVGGAVRRLEQLIEAAVAAVPDCPGAVGLRRLLQQQVTYFIPARAALGGQVTG